MDFSFSDLNFNSVENLPGFEARAAFLCYGKALRDDPVNSASVFREDVDIVRGCIKIQTHPLFIYIEKHKKSPDFPKPGLCHITKNLYLCDI